MQLLASCNHNRTHCHLVTHTTEGYVLSSVDPGELHRLRIAVPQKLKETLMKEAHGGPNDNSSGVMHACNVDLAATVLAT